MIKRLSLLVVFFFIFAISGQAQERFDAPKYDQRGSYAVGTMELVIEDDIRPLTVTIWYPAQGVPGDEPEISYRVAPLLSLPGAAYRDAEPLSEGTPYPLIVYSHGNNGARVVSLFLTEHLASQGFIVIAADHPGNNIETRMSGDSDLAVAYALRPTDVIRQIDYAADVLSAGGGFLEDLIDMQKVGVMGHSFGGWTALSVAGGRTDFGALHDFCEPLGDDDGVCFVQDLAEGIATARGYDSIPDDPWEAISDSRIDAVVAMAPWNGPLLDVSEITAPTLVIVGGSDSVTIPERDAFAIYERLQSPASLMTLEFADHYIFVDECSPLFVRFELEALCTDPVWDMARVHDLINHAATAFFLANLKNDSEADAVLQSGGLDFVGVSYQSK